MRHATPKRAREDRAYRRWVAELAEADDSCHVCRRIIVVDPRWRGCTRRMDGLHHLRKRSAGGGRRNPANVLRSCNNGNGWVEDHPDLARLAGLVVRQGDPLWCALA